MFVCSIMALPKMCLAETAAVSNDFYPRDYAKEVVRDAVVRPSVLSESTTNRPPAPSAVTEEDNEQHKDKMQETFEQSTHKDLKNQNFPAFISVYVNSKDPQHFSRAVYSVLKLNSSEKVLVGCVFHIGDYRNITPQQKNLLQSAGITLHPLDSVPEHLSALKSPVWEVFQETKTTLLSGIFDVGRFFNAAGSLKFDSDQISSSVSVQELDGF